MPATVLGWSGGGVVAAGLAIEHPDLVSSLILEEAGDPPAAQQHLVAAALGG